MPYPFRSLPAIALLALLLTGCDKKPKSPRPAYVAILTAGPWRLHLYMRFVRVNANRVDTINELQAMPPCETDNVFTFTASDGPSSGDLLIDEGASKCHPSLPQQAKPLWWNIPYEPATTMIISDGDIANGYALEYLSDTVLRLSQGEDYNPMRGMVESKVLVYRRLP